MKDSAQTFFDLQRINENYKRVINDFDRINAAIDCKRDNFDAAMARNMLYAYDYINNRFASIPGDAFLSWKDVLELNMIVHLGVDADTRTEYYKFIRHTEERFEARFPLLMQWYDRHERNEDDPYKIAAGLYVRVLAQPQMFIEGNHRTGSLVANYYLLIKERDPFVLTPNNAVEFLNLASDVKFKSQDIQSKFRRALGWHDELARMRIFLEENAQPFTTRVLPKWTPDLEQQETEASPKRARRRSAVIHLPQHS
jgi:prophage maintenance system killer protein